MSVAKTEELMKLLATSTDKKAVENKLGEIRHYYQNNMSELVQKSTIIPQVAEWLKANINSAHCFSLFKFIIRLYELMGFKRNSDINEYFRCHEKVFNKDPKFVSKSYLEGYDPASKNKDVLIDNPLLDFTVFHVSLTVITSFSKSADIKKFGPTIYVLTNLISLYCYDSKFSLSRSCADNFATREDLEDLDIVDPGF